MRYILTLSILLILNYANVLYSDDTVKTSKTNKYLVDEIFRKMELAVDPDELSLNLKTLKTEVLLTLAVGNQTIKVTTIDKFPFQSKTIQEMPNGMSLIKVLNKDSAWEQVLPSGQLRIITGKELDFLKFEMFMKTPSVKLNEIFTDVEILDTEAVINDYECYKLQCQATSSLDLPLIIMFVDKETFLTREMDVNLETPQGKVVLKNTMNKYELINGRMLPTEMTISQGGVKMLKKLLNVYENITVKDSAFELPTSNK